MAATNINRVVLTGNLTADPELRSLASGNSVCKLRIACNTRRKNNATGTWEDKPNYFDVTVWGAQGENCARFLAKGRPVAHRRPARVARVGDARGPQAPGGRHHRRRRAVPRRPRRRRAAVAAASPRAPTSRSTTATSSPPARARRSNGHSRAGGRRHPVLARPALRARAAARRSLPGAPDGPARGPPTLWTSRAQRGARASTRVTVFFERGSFHSGEAAQPADAPA